MEEVKEWKDPRPFFMTYDVKKNRWILNVKDPVTDQVVEKRAFMNGMWKEVKDELRK